MSDAYDKAVESLKGKTKGEIYDIWGNPDLYKNGPSILFSYAGVDRYGEHTCNIGCLTMIRRSPDLFWADTPELTKAILEDDRIPTHIDDCEDFTIFAEWQRRIDKELGREPPVWNNPAK